MIFPIRPFPPLSIPNQKAQNYREYRKCKQRNQNVDWDDTRKCTGRPDVLLDSGVDKISSSYDENLHQDPLVDETGMQKNLSGVPVNISEEIMVPTKSSLTLGTQRNRRRKSHSHGQVKQVGPCSGGNGRKTLRQLHTEEDDEERFQADLKKAVCQSLDTFQARKSVPLKAVQRMAEKMSPEKEDFGVLSSRCHSKRQ
ncbi:hypothetical protein L1049_003260 [Liquidambar formosana]|uniref:Uncharacterized protein n=1 Tax=Liquidambar formosana TaxID=63359 RepID=A0AAP0R9J2_LIQFO